MRLSHIEVGFLSALFLAGSGVSTALPQARAAAAVTTLSQSQVNTFNPYTHYASTAGCDPALTLTWTCGANCAANPTFKPTASGGNGATVQYWFVGYDPTLKTVIVSHQGTDPEKILPLITDADIGLETLSTSLFPGVPSNVKVHGGFQESQADTAASVLAAVKKTMSANNVQKVTVTGWSLGAAIAVIDGLYLHQQLPTVDVSVIGYGMPRVGNQEWANYVDQQLAGKVTHNNNQDDPVPILPGRFLGFHHVSGENHIQDDGTWDACPGQDNTDERCTTGDVDNVFVGDVDDHFGPYNGIIMGC